jgi:hypothetical protein
VVNTKGKPSVWSPWAVATTFANLRDTEAWSTEHGGRLRNHGCYQTNASPSRRHGEDFARDHHWVSPMPLLDYGFHLRWSQQRSHRLATKMVVTSITIVLLTFAAPRMGVQARSAESVSVDLTALPP